MGDISPLRLFSISLRLVIRLILPRKRTSWFLLVVGAILPNATPLNSHDIYSGWKTDKGVGCCNGSDCRPVRALQDYDGSWVAVVDGRLVPVPPSQLLKIRSPDGRSHWCGKKINDTWITFCFVPGEVRT